MGACKRTSRL